MPSINAGYKYQTTDAERCCELGEGIDRVEEERGVAETLDTQVTRSKDNSRTTEVAVDEGC